MIEATDRAVSFGELATFKQIIYGVQDEDERRRREGVNAMRRLDPGRLALLLQFFDYDNAKARRANRVRLMILGAAACFAVGANDPGQGDLRGAGR